MTPVIPAKMRILVGANSFADAVTALQIARAVAAEFAASLGGLLVDDDDIRAVCALPHQRVISASGALLLSPSQAQIRTLMNAEARAFRQLLQQIADPAALDWSFDQQMGDLVGTTMAAAVGWDTLIFGYRSSHPFVGKVVALEPSRPDDGRLGALAETLARQLQTELVVFDVGAGARPHPARRRFVDPQDAIAALNQMNAQAVLIDLSRGPIRSPGSLRKLIAAARCPVIVLGASAATPRVVHDTHFPVANKQPPRAT